MWESIIFATGVIYSGKSMQQKDEMCTEFRSNFCSLQSQVQLFLKSTLNKNESGPKTDS